MKIPKKVKIGAVNWKIKVADTVNDPASNVELFGMTRYATETIHIAKSHSGASVTETSMADTFLHEIIHAISQTFGLGLTEKQVAGMAGGVLMVLRDNKLDFSDRTKP